MIYAVVTDRTPNRCTIASIEYTRDEAEQAAERLDTGINGMPAEVMPVSPGDPGNLEEGDRAWHDGEMCFSEAGCLSEQPLRCADHDRGAPYARQTR